MRISDIMAMMMISTDKLVLDIIMSSLCTPRRERESSGYSLEILGRRAQVTDRDWNISNKDMVFGYNVSSLMY
jgi:hypothetical protein